MLSNIELNQEMSKEDYKAQKKELEIKMGMLQRKIKEYQIPVLLVFEGWGAAGKGKLISRVLYPLDPRGVKVHTTNRLLEDDIMHPLLWTFWINTPLKGKMTIFDKSWHTMLLRKRFENSVSSPKVLQMFEDINNFEQQLADDGAVIMKFFLHISKDEQKKRIKEISKNKSTSWRITEEDRKQNKHYEQYRNLIEDMIQKTHTDYAPWYVIESENSKYAAIKTCKIFVERIEQAIQNIEKKKIIEKAEIQPVDMNVPEISILNTIDLSKTITKEEYKQKLEFYQNKVRELEYKMYAKRIPVVIAFEGWDAAGKGGSIKRLTEEMDPRGYRVIPIASPTKEELDHHYLWRFWKEMPKDGHMAIFDRSWYGRVMVERLEGFCTTEEWQRAYTEINQMEQHIANHGAVILKFWMHIDKDEQLARFKARQENPLKQWKITDEDWRNREKWDLYEKAVNEMLFRTNTDYAPWIIVESNSKQFARIKVLETVVNAIEEKLKNLK